MTWLKLSDDFADECADRDLSDAAFRTHVEGLLWVMRRETDGRISHRDVRRFAESIDVDRAIPELLTAEFWLATDDGYLIQHHMEHQPESDVIRKRRDLDAERQRRQRRKKAGLDDGQDGQPRNPMSRRDDMRDPGRGGSGRDGTGNPERAFTEEEEKEDEQPEEDWPEVNEPGSVADGSWADKLWDRER